jgi:cysteine dioxygenase
MPKLLDVHPLRTSVGDVIAGLRSLETGVISQARVLEYLSGVQLRYAALSPYVFWKGSHYTRNLIFRDELFEVLALCWLPGQKTPVHTHNEQLGWMTVVQGEVLTHQYRYVRCSSPENQNVVGLDCLAGGHYVEFQLLGTTVCADDGGVTMSTKYKPPIKSKMLIRSLRLREPAYLFEADRFLRGLRFEESPLRPPFPAVPQRSGRSAFR